MNGRILTAKEIVSDVTNQLQQKQHPDATKYQQRQCRDYVMSVRCPVVNERRDEFLNTSEHSSNGLCTVI